MATHHKSVVKNDIKQAMKIVQNMDKRWNLWQEVSLDESASEKPEPVDENVAKQQQPQDAESNEIANLEKSAFSKLVPNGPKYLPHKVGFLVSI